MSNNINLQTGQPVVVQYVVAQQGVVLQQLPPQQRQIYLLPPAPPPNYGTQSFYVPPPTVEQSAAPQGRGLMRMSDDDTWALAGVGDFCDGDIEEVGFKTQGGYTIAFDDESQSMKIWGPDQVPTEDDPMTEVWGDPHVEVNGERAFDFTKDGDMVLPDGTLIAMDTTSESGKSYLSTVDIVSGNDHVTVTGIDQNEPKASFVKPDGIAFRENHMATKAPGRHTYLLGAGLDGKTGTDDDHFNLFVYDVDQGKITGADYENETYIPKTDGTELYHVNNNLAPPIGSDAWKAQYLQLQGVYGPSGSRDLSAYLDSVQNAGNIVYLQNHSNVAFAHQSPQNLIAHGQTIAAGQAVVLGAAAPMAAGPLQGNPNAGHLAQANAVMNDPNLSVEDKVAMLLLLIMKKQDEEILKKAEEIQNIQNQNANAGKKAGGADGGGSNSAPSIDVETMELERMIKKRGQMFDMLRSIISKYDETAKNMINQISR